MARPWRTCAFGTRGYPMNMSLRLRSKTLPALVLGLIAATTTVIAGATPLPAGTTVYPTGTSLAADPTLAGAVLANLNTPFDCGGGLKGSLYAEAFQNSQEPKTIDFYYRVTVDSAATQHVHYVNATDFGQALNLDVNYRTDGTGLPPKSVSRTADGKTISYYFSDLLGPGVQTSVLLARGGRASYNSSGTVTIVGDTTSCTIPGTFYPVP